ncbi:hypothetical protein GOODEAATRI_021225, partial [Goodea atripinnis]
PEMKDDPMECPLCMEPLEIDDVNFFPCTCGYQICRFCWHRIRTDENGLCPACRKVQTRFIGPSASAYVTYIRSEDALRAIQCVNNVVVDGRTLKVNETNSSNGKDGWPTLSGHNKLANGLSEDRKSPPLLDYLDQEASNSDGLESELGPGQRPTLSPFSSNCDSNSKQQDDDLGFDPFDVTRKALADLIEKELSVQDQSPLSPGPLSQGGSHSSGLPSSNPSTSHHFPSGLPRVHQLHHRAIYSSFSFPGGHNSQASQQQPPAARHPWMGIPTRNNLAHLNHSASAASHSNILDLNLPPQHNTGLGGIPISGTKRLGISHSLSWDGTASWMDPAIITGIPASTGSSLDCLQDDNPPHWLKSLQALTEMDGPASSAVPTPQPLHSGLLDGHLPLHHRAPSGWAPYLPPPTANPTGQFHSPPPGFQTAFRPPGQPATELLQSAAVDRH